MTDVSARRWIAAFGLVAALAMAATGCSSRGVAPSTTVMTAPAEPSAEPADASPAVETSDERMPRLSDLRPGTVIATGEFDRGAVGRIEILANGDDRGFDVRLSGLDPAPPQGASLELNAFEPTASDDELRGGYSYYRYDALAPASDQTLTTPGEGYGGFETNDPSYLRTAVVWQALDGTPIGLGSVVATAALTWSLPDMNPGLAEVADRGSTAGARGDVITVDGRAQGYRVAYGDTASAVTARFGIDERDLEWLNPDRDRGRLLLADVTLNLSREARGLRG
ncbi:LysM peptidoglycan-binding domain-containing protein [Agromyces sp. GXS1127]|uniref:LysM peptidoglycan-binding domain-containing protein n=1 Tax=Agromyces sp. GXS1127 TaxID=3424181 RepID=UPI003D31EA76